MAKQMNGYLGGFTGRLGTAVGYQWNGIWCLRRLPVEASNPRTVKQMAHRQAFKDQVQLAAAMRTAVLAGLTAESRMMGMTSYNLFVHLNQQAFSLVEGGMQTDWRQLRVSAGPVAPVAFGPAAVDGDNVLSVSFQRNPMKMRCNGDDGVRVYAYCPELGWGYLSAPVYRNEQRVRFALPDAFAGKELQLYGFVQDYQGQCSESQYIAWDDDTAGQQDYVALGRQVDGATGLRDDKTSLEDNIDNAKQHGGATCAAPPE